MSDRQNAAWHYTTGTCAAAIVADGCIKPATAFVPAHERPVVWFSRLTRWEPTATKWLVDSKTGQPRSATQAEMETRAKGLYRFGVDAKDLLGWPELVKRARISKRDARVLAMSGMRQGAEPALWMGSLTSVPLTQVSRMQRWFDGTWISDPSELNDTSRSARIHSQVRQ